MFLLKYTSFLRLTSKLPPLDTDATRIEETSVTATDVSGTGLSSSRYIYGGLM